MPLTTDNLRELQALRLRVKDLTEANGLLCQLVRILLRPQTHMEVSAGDFATRLLREAREMQEKEESDRETT